VAEAEPEQEMAAETPEGEAGEEIPEEPGVPCETIEQALSELAAAALSGEMSLEMSEETVAEEPPTVVEFAEISHLFVGEQTAQGETSNISEGLETHEAGALKQGPGTEEIGSEEVPTQEAEWNVNAGKTVLAGAGANVVELPVESQDSRESPGPESEPLAEVGEDSKEKKPAPRKSLLQSYLPFS
jgi:hypothetical protein